MAKIPVDVIGCFVTGTNELSKLPVSKALAAQFKVVPLRLKINGKGRVSIDRITNICREASLKAGGIGIKYTCHITVGDKQKMVYVFREDDSWYLEDDFY